MSSQHEFSTRDTLENIPSEVIELVGIEKVTEIETLSAMLRESSDLLKLPNPFDKEVLSPEESIIDEPTHQAIQEVNRADEIKDQSSEEVSTITRSQAPILSRATTTYKKIIKDQFNQQADRMDKIKEEIDALVDKSHEVCITELALIYGEMEELHSNLPALIHLKELQTIVDAEERARYLDGFAVGSRKHAWMAQRLNEIKSSRHLLKTRKDEYTRLHRAIALAGLQSWRIKHSHRRGDKIYDDAEFAEASPKTLQNLSHRGTNLYEYAKGVLEGKTSQTAGQLLSALIQAKSEALSITVSTERDSMESVQAEIIAKIGVEEYLADKTTFLESVYHQTETKLKPEMRKTIHELKETAIKSGLNRLSKKVVAHTLNPYESVAPDNLFRKDCKETKDVLAGGGRIEHPDARALANALHGLKSDEANLLEPEESGLVVAMATGRLDPVLRVIQRFEAAAEIGDEQIVKLQFELPEQFNTISTFDLESAVKKLKLLIDDESERQRIFGVFPNPQSIQEVTQKLDDLSRKLFEPGEVTETVNTESEPKDQEVTSSTEVNGDNLAIIDENIAQIAEQLEWTVFPQGSSVGDVQRILNDRVADLTKVNWERIKHLIYLAERFEGNIYRSSESKLGTTVPYLVATLNIQGRQIAVAECPEIGNATYIVDNNLAAGTWEEVMRLNKAEARNLGARRVIHPKEEGHLEKIIKSLNSLLLVKA